MVYKFQLVDNGSVPELSQLRTSCKYDYLTIN